MHDRTKNQTIEAVQKPPWPGMIFPEITPVEISTQPNLPNWVKTEKITTKVKSIKE